MNIQYPGTHENDDDVMKGGCGCVIQGGKAKSSACSLAVFVFWMQKMRVDGPFVSLRLDGGLCIGDGFSSSLFGKGGLIGLGGSFRPGVCVGKRVFGGGRSCV